MTQFLRVLIVEDLESDAEQAIRQLEKAGHEVQWERVETAEDMLASLKRQAWDVVISDYQLPQFSAPSSLATLRKTGLDIPFIVVSGHIGEETAVNMMRLGAQDYLMKDNLSRLVPAVVREVADARVRARGREAEEHIRRLASTQIAILNALPAHIALVNPRGVILAVNEAWRRFSSDSTLLSPAYTVGSNYLEACELAVGAAAAEGRAAASGIRRVLSGELPDFSLEYACHTSYAKRWFRLNVSPLHDSEHVGVVVMHLNITDRKIAEEALRKSEEKFRRIIDVTPVPIALNDSQETVTFLNPQFLKTFGYTRDDLQNLTQWWSMAYPDPQYRHWVIAEWQSRIERAHRGDAFEPMEVNVRCKDGSIRTVVVGAAELGESFDGTHLVTLFDITDRKAAEEKLRQSESHHRQAAAFNQRLVQEVNHRVRNNLAALLSLISLTRRRASDLSGFAASIEDRVRSLARVHNLMASADWQGMELGNMITNLSEMWQPSGQRGGRISVDGARIFVPSGQVLPLASSMVELFNNAVKYGSLSVATGRVAISWTITEAANGAVVKLHWQETGGPAISSPVKSSIGTELVEGFVTYDLNGKCTLGFPPDGADHTFEFQIIKQKPVNV